MTPTIYQKPEIRDANDNIIQQGAFGKNTALANATNDGWIDYVANDLEFLYDLAKDEVVPVSALPASGDMNKTYLLTTTGVCYRWDGAAWVAISSSEAVGRAETAANLAEQWATKTDGTVADNEYSAKYYANAAQQSADDAQDVADDMADHLAQIDQNTGGVSANSKRIGNIEKLLQGNLYDYQTDSSSAYTKTVPSGAMPYAGVEKVGGKTVVWNQLVDSGTTTVNTISGHKYYTLIDGTASIVTSDGTAISVVDDTADMVCDLTLMFGSGNEPSTVAEFESMFPADYYAYNAGTLLSAGVIEVVSTPKNYLDNATFVQGGITELGTNTTDSARVRTDNFLSVSGNTNYVVSVDNVRVYYVFYYSSNSTSSFISYTVVDSASATITTPSTAQYVRISYRKAGNVAITPSEIVNPLLRLASSSVVTYPIPAAVRALEGYGWSAGSVYNYVDFERKVFVKNVGMVVLDGTTNIVNGVVAYGSSNHRFRGNYVGSSVKYDENNTNGVASPIPFVFKDTIQSPDLAQTDAVFLFTNNVFFITTTPNGTNISTVADMNTWLQNNPITVHYELATPVETDISEYLTDDNLIQVESGGTLTFPNSNGDDYRLPVPSEEEYMIDLQEAL